MRREHARKPAAVEVALVGDEGVDSGEPVGGGEAAEAVGLVEGGGDARLAQEHAVVARVDERAERDVGVAIAVELQLREAARGGRGSEGAREAPSLKSSSKRCPSVQGSAWIGTECSGP